MNALAGDEQLYEKVDTLTEENQRHFLGVVEALAFAQTVDNTSKQEKPGTAHFGTACHAD